MMIKSRKVSFNGFFYHLERFFGRGKMFIAFCCFTFRRKTSAMIHVEWRLWQPEGENYSESYNSRLGCKSERQEEVLGGAHDSLGVKRAAKEAKFWELCMSALLQSGSEGLIESNGRL
jgi:hypothetical protein